MILDELQIENRLSKVEERSKSNTHRLDDVEEQQKNISSLVKSVALMAQEQEHIKTDVKDIKKDVKTLTDKPGKRWEAVVEKIIYAIVAAIVGFVIARAGL